MPHPPPGGPGKSGSPVGLTGEQIEVLALARQYGVPRSIVLGEPWPAPGEPLWSPDDLEAAIAYERWLAERCPRCGTFEAEWIDPATNRRHDVDRYEPESVQCPGCAALEQWDAGMKDPKGRDRTPGMRTRLRRVYGPDDVPLPGIFGAVAPRPEAHEHDHGPLLNPLRFRF